MNNSTPGNEVEDERRFHSELAAWRQRTSIGANMRLMGTWMATAIWRDTNRHPTDTSKHAMSLSVASMGKKQPARVGHMCQKTGSKARTAMDRFTGRDLRRQYEWGKAWSCVREYHPELISGSPMCTPLSKLQNVAGWHEQKQRHWTYVREHILSRTKVGQHPTEHHTWLWHGQPAEATSWALLEIVQRLEK